MPKAVPLVLLTGASGFIGNRIRSYLYGKGYRLRLLLRKDIKVLPNEEAFFGDITNPPSCHAAMRGVQIVMHAAGEKRDIKKFSSVNIRGTENLLNASLDEGIERFVHLSSVGVIGANPLQERIFNEDDPCAPKNEYERSKWEAENLVNEASSKGLPVSILRPANVFGDRDPEQGLLRLIKSLMNGWFIYAGGRDVMCNFVYVDDVAHACLLLAEHSGAVGRTYHISDDCYLGEFVDALANELEVRKPTYQLSGALCASLKAGLRVIKRSSVVSRYSFVSRLVSLNNQAKFSSTKLADELGFRFLVGWREGISRTVKWYRSQNVI